MLFSNLVATIRADLDAIRDDLGEFVTTVKTDTTAMLGLSADGGNAPPPLSSTPKFPQWEEELWENPDLLCEDPDAQGWEETVQVKEEEVESLLSGAVSDVVPELYRELVPARATHADFFKRLIYHRNRLNQMIHNRVQELAMNNDDEEETRWDEDDDDSIPVEAVNAAAQQQESLPSTADLDLQQELDKHRKEMAALEDKYKKEMAALEQKIAELDQALKQSEEKRMQLQAILDDELPHKKVSPPAVTEKISASPSEAFPAPSITAPSPSWEALPASPDSTSNEEPVVISSKPGDDDEDDEEDDWE